MASPQRSQFYHHPDEYFQVCIKPLKYLDLSLLVKWFSPCALGFHLVLSFHICLSIIQFFRMPEIYCSCLSQCVIETSKYNALWSSTSTRMYTYLRRVMGCFENLVPEFQSKVCVCRPLVCHTQEWRLCQRAVPYPFYCPVPHFEVTTTTGDSLSGECL